MRRRSRRTCTSSALRVGSAVGPGPVGERVARDDRAEAIEQRGRERLLDRRQRDPLVAVVQQPVVVEVGRDAVRLGPARQRAPARVTLALRTRRRAPSPRDSRASRAIVAVR